MYHDQILPSVLPNRVYLLGLVNTVLSFRTDKATVFILSIGTS